jgi:predicted RNA binding protein YcfA (HicA-like mRNA interferase family)
MTKARLEDIDKCKNGPECKSFALHNGGREVRQTGSHCIVEGPNGGIAVLPMHKNDLPVGTKKSIVKQFISIGIIAALFFMLVLPVIRAVVEKFGL